MDSNSQKRFRVLVVDDELAVLRSIAEILSEDVDVVGCVSGEQALSMLESGRFHLVCSDYKMQGMNGEELLRRVASMPFYTSCLLITGADEYIRDKGRGNHYVILKPFSPERMIRIVLQLARLAEMKRSVNSMSDTVAPPDSRWSFPANGAAGQGALRDSVNSPESSRTRAFASRGSESPPPSSQSTSLWRSMRTDLQAIHTPARRYKDRLG